MLGVWPLKSDGIIKIKEAIEITIRKTNALKIDAVRYLGKHWLAAPNKMVKAIIPKPVTHRVCQISTKATSMYRAANFHLLVSSKRPDPKARISPILM